MAALSTAIIGSAIIGGGAALAGGAMQAGAAKDAAKASSRATRDSLALQRETRDLQRADQEPWRVAGANALGRISDPSRVMGNFQASPDYQFRMSEGLKGVTQNRAVNGLLGSGSALRGLNDYAQNTAAGEFGNWWNREAGLAGVGQAANAANAQAGQAYANNAQNALMANAQAQGQSSYNAANAWAQGLGGAAGAAAWGLNNLPFGAQSGKFYNKGY